MGSESGPSPAIFTIPSSPQHVFSREDGTVEYPIRVELTRGKGKTTVKFQADPKTVAGGVFGCVMLKGAASQ